MAFGRDAGDFGIVIVIMDDGHHHYPQYHHYPLHDDQGLDPSGLDGEMHTASDLGLVRAGGGTHRPPRL